MIQRTIDGYLYNILGDNTEELYWSEKDLNEDDLKSEYQAYEIDIFSDGGDFEEWWNDRNPDIYIHRTFLNEIYI